MAQSKPTRSDALRNRTRVIDAAVGVFSEEGVSASTETIAERAGVGVGTVFRHFPTKTDLLAAVLAHMFEELTRAANTGLASSDPGSAFFGVLTRIIDQAATKKAVSEALGGQANEVHRRAYIGGFREAMSNLLARAQAAKVVRRDVGIEEVMAVIVAAFRAADHAGSDAGLRRRSVAVIFDGLRAGARSSSKRST
jgi:AcrR family transcriptional regulator